MKIISGKIVNTRITHRITCQLDGETEPFSLILTTDNGLVKGDHKNGVSTSKLSYFYLPEKTRIKHFNFIKNYLESKLRQH